jgi:phosphoenolpyruvate carboxylase
MNEQIKPAPVTSERLDETALREQLRSMRSRIPDRPAMNPIVNLAFDLSRRLESGSTTFDDMRALATRLMDRACIRRAEALRERIGYKDQAATLKEFSDYIERSLGEPVSGDEAMSSFAERWARARTGIVLTAHPTFGLSQALSRRMVEIAASGIDSHDEPLRLVHRPDEKVDIAYEHKCAEEAIVNLRNSYLELLNGFYSVAAQRFGDKAYTLRPKLATFASWIGYDLDGRTDILWSDSFRIRLHEKRDALSDIRERFIAIKHKIGDGDGITRLSRQITGKLDLAIAAVDEQIRALHDRDPSIRGLAKAANIITRGDNYNMTSTEPLVQLIEQMIAAVDQPQWKRSLASLKGLVEATGLGMSHIHVRINAVQVANAFRAFVHEPWTRDLSERQALSRIVEMIKSVKPESVNFESLELETATAIRQFGLIAQIQKHVDRDTPIRFLIAECESPATILIAVFFAKLFGVSDIVDISPLFETPAGLESGSRLIERLLEEDAYKDYVKTRGRLAYQTGFSDAGRFVGQIAATLAIERLHNAIADLVAKADMPGVETLIFSTHGESMGRGAHPGDLKRRLNYVFSEESRRRFARAGLALKHETSFQGGDGYMFFGNRQLTARVLATVVMDGEEPAQKDDPLYADQNLALDFLLRLRSYQQHLFAHPGYRAVLGAFGPNMLFKTGSRAVKRQSDGGNPADRGDPSRMRAIPNNAILQQFGYVANVVAGLGAAVGSERDRFIQLAKQSPRLRPLIEMIARAKQLSSLNAMQANAIVFDAGFWASRASWGREPHLETAFRALATHLLSDTRNGAINGLVHHLRLDAIDLHAILEEIGLEGGKIPDDNRLELDLLQAIRLALIMRIFILAAQLPRFASRGDLDYEQVFNWALGLEVPEVVKVMRQAFPKRSASNADGAVFDEKATYRPHGIDDYGRIETEILEPMERAYELAREIGTGITHHFGAFG